MVVEWDKHRRNLWSPGGYALGLRPPNELPSRPLPKVATPERLERSMAERDQQTERWTIHVCAKHGPVDAESIGRTESGPFHASTAHGCFREVEEVEVVPAQTAERLATAAEQILTTPRDERRLSHWTELQDAISAFRAGSSKEGQ
jgi:hypothetical protein